METNTQYSTDMQQVPDDVSLVRGYFHERLLSVVLPRKKTRVPLSSSLSLLVVSAFSVFTFSQKYQQPIPTVSYVAMHEAASANILSDVSTGSIKDAPQLNDHSAMSGKTIPPASTSHVSSGTIFRNQVPLPSRPDSHRGVFLTAYKAHDADFLQSTIDAVHALSGNTLVIDVKGNNVSFDSSAPMANSLGLVSGIYDLEKIVNEAHKNHVYLIGRYDAISDNGFTSVMTGSVMQDPVTNEVLSEGFIDPIDDAALQYNAEILCEIAKSGIDEINLDYIRFSSADHEALQIFSGDQKAARLQRFIEMAHRIIHRCGPKTKLGISTFAILGWSYKPNVETLGQDVVRFAPFVDVISPMAYPDNFTSSNYYNPKTDSGSRMYHLVWQTLKGYQDLLGPEQSKKLRPWLQGFDVTAVNVQDQVQAVFDAGVCGYMMWNSKNLYDVSYEGIAPVKVPSVCR